MQEEWYEPSPRDKRWADAFFATPEGKIALEQYEDRDQRALEYRIRQGYVPSPKEMVKHLEWLAKHPMK